MDEFDTKFLTDVVGHIYETAADPQHWQEFVTVLERAYPHSRVTLFGHEPGRPASSLRVSENYDPDDLKAYIDHHAKTSPYLARVHNIPVGQPACSEMMITDEELTKTEHYNEYMRPRRLGHYATGMVIDRGPGRFTGLSIADHRNDADRRARQLKLVEILGPHLMRALRLHRAIAAQKATGDAAQAALDRWVHAALVLNSQGGLVAINHVAELLLQRDDGLRLGRDGQLRCVDETRTRALDAAIRKCAAIAGAMDVKICQPDLDGVVLPRPSGAAPLRAMMWPLPFLGAATSSEFGAGTVLLVIFDPDQVQRTPVGWLAQQYGLTPAEQRLAEAIINGVPLAEAAERLGIQESTARTRLKIIQAKTDCRRQVDLVRLAHAMPAVRQDDPLLHRPADETARAERQQQRDADGQRGGHDREHRERPGALEHRQQCERDQRGGDAIHRPGGGNDRRAQPGRKSLGRVDVDHHDVDRADQLEGDAGRHQRQRRGAGRKRQAKQRH
jgi:DNA-binding CsgD family transcriptional regulator